MEISLDLIKQLREKTGAGMGDCKNALTEAEGDLDKAVDVLRKKGIAKAAKRSDRETGEGVIKVAVNEEANEGYMVELRAETDFVTRSEKFQALADQVIELAKASRAADLEALLEVALNGSTIRDALANLSGVVGEKMEISRYAILTSGGTVAVYSHAGGRIGALVAIDKAGDADLAREIAMQVAAANPKCLYPEDVDPAELEREKDIYREQLAKEGKPAEMLEKILGGKLAKYYEEVCLVKQEYIKDDKKKIEQLLDGAKIEKFFRFGL